MSDRRARGLLSSLSARNAANIRSAQRQRARVAASAARPSVRAGLARGKIFEHLTGLVTLGPVTIQENVINTFPPGNNAVSIPASPPYTTLKITVNLALADKLAGEYSLDSGGRQIVINGKSLDLVVYLSIDGNTTGGERRFAIAWHSYGPSGLSITGPDGNLISNPDPSIVVPLTVFAGQGAYLTLITHGITSIGATIDGRTTSAS